MANKRGPLSKVEVFYIQEHAKSGVSLNDIAQDLDRPIKSIEKCYKSATKQQAIEQKAQFASHKGSVVMTQNASMLADAKRKNKPNPQSTNCITKIRNV